MTLETLLLLFLLLLVVVCLITIFAEEVCAQYLLHDNDRTSQNKNVFGKIRMMWNFYSVRVFVVAKKVQRFGTKANGFKEDLQTRVIFT